MGEGNETGEDDHQLWVNLSAALGEGNIFAVLPELMKTMMEEEATKSGDAAMAVVLPSDDAWQAKIYFKLVERQRMIHASPDENETMLDPLLREEKTTKLHDWNIIPKPKTAPCEPRLVEKRTERNRVEPVTWTVSDLAKAGCLLSTPPQVTNFEDEQEMRRVYTLIYDVFRYKNVLTQSLNDISFFQIFPKLVSTVPHVWLLLYDLYHRGFKQRELKYVAEAAKLFDSVGLRYAENALWTQNVRLAAAISRLRIKHNALSLSELLPPHLKNEKVTEQAKNGPVTCWVNSRKVKDLNRLIKDIEHTFKLKMTATPMKFHKTYFKWDSHCPQTMAFHASMRAELARSSFVREHVLIIQDKSFCLGPATFGKLVADLELTGSVIQTHVNSPRTTAYLATLLFQNEKIKRLMAFSAGKRKGEYESYFQELGVTNITIFSDRLIDTPLDANYMEEVVAVFATPPNSYSAVVDPIDLVCSRGGDLSMLEVLTETDDTKEARKRIATILEEQNMTLRFAMSRPQIQFVLYETHSQLEEENSVMVNKALREINRVAKLHHATLQGKIANVTSDTQSDREINNNYNMDSSDDISLVTKPSSEGKISIQSTDNEQRLLEDIQVPTTDIFDQPDLPTLCPSENCKNFEKEGCFLALLQRKEVIRLNDKYMIQMAEHRGLFGSNTTTATAKSRSSRAAKKKQEKSPEKTQRPKKKLKESEIDRIAAPTHTFLRHTKPKEQVNNCEKNEPMENKANQYQQWWTHTTRHILELKDSLVRQKIVAADKIKRVNAKEIANSMAAHNSNKIDEVVANTNRNKRFPVFPKLRLNRSHACQKVKSSSDIIEIVQPESEQCIEKMKRRNVCVGTTNIAAKNILGRLNSMQIRQLVSPFYKSTDTVFQPKNKQPSYLAGLGLKKHSLEKLQTVIAVNSDRGYVSIDMVPKKSYIGRKNKGSKRGKTRDKKSKSLTNLPSGKSKRNNSRVEEIIRRVSTPTESSLRKACTFQVRRG